MRFVTGASSVREDLLTPVAATGPMAGLALTYAHASGRTRFEADARAGLAVRYDRLSAFGVGFNHDVGARYLVSVGPAATSSRAALAFGGFTRFATDVSYLSRWDDAHGYWLATWGLGPAVRYARPVSSRRWLVAGGEITLLALASRPPERRLNKQDALPHLSYYLDRIAADPGLTSVWSLQQLRAELALRSGGATGASADAGGWTLGAELRLSRDAEPRPYTSLYTGLFVGWGWGR